MAAPRPGSTPAPGPGGGPGPAALGLEQYLRSAVRDELRLPPVPARDGARLPSSTRLLLKRREMAEVERVLQSQRQEFQQRMERLAQRRQQLRQREEQLRDVMLKFDAFLKARQERVLWQTEKGAEAARLHQELAGLLRRRDHLAQHLQSLRGFRDYLRGVLDMGQFQDVPAMLAHFGALVAARAVLAQEAEAGQERLAQGQARLQRYQEEAHSELLGTTEELAQLRAHLEAARHDVLQGESRWAHMQSTATQKSLLLGQIKLAVLHLFQLATTHLKVPVDVALDDTEAQLDTVLLCMQGLATSCAEPGPRQPGTRLPRLPAATSRHPACRGGARVPLSQEHPRRQPPAPAAGEGLPWPA